MTADIYDSSLILEEIEMFPILSDYMVADDDLKIFFTLYKKAVMIRHVSQEIVFRFLSIFVLANQKKWACFAKKRGIWLSIKPRPVFYSPFQSKKFIDVNNQLKEIPSKNFLSFPGINQTITLEKILIKTNKAKKPKWAD